MEADFSGYATKAGLKCSDGRTIMPNAFQHQDNMRVPLVWQHGHLSLIHISEPTRFLRTDPMAFTLMDFSMILRKHRMLEV